MFRSSAIRRHREPNAVPPETAENNRAAMADTCKRRPSACSAALSLSPKLEDVIGFQALYTAARKCFKGVGWKQSTQSYMIHIIENTVRLARDLASGKYKEGRTHVVPITFPKKRTAIAIAIRDRIVQRSVNDNRTYPAMTRSLIYANFACQAGKGTDAARNYWKAALHRAFLRYGHTNNFKIVVVDFRDYYGSMLHDLTNAMFRSRLDPWSGKFTTQTLDRQYKGRTGYNPGSQMVQIAGISYPDRIDHHMKERVHAKTYMHYMDDFQMAARDKKEAEMYLAEIRREAAKLGLTLHPEKTQIVDAKDGAVLLGFLYRVTDSGKVLMFRAPSRIKEVKRRLRRLAHKEARGEAPRGTTSASFKCVRSCCEKGNSARLLAKMDKFHEQLKGEIHDRRRDVD